MPTTLTRNAKTHIRIIRILLLLVAMASSAWFDAGPFTCGPSGRVTLFVCVNCTMHIIQSSFKSLALLQSGQSVAPHSRHCSLLCSANRIQADPCGVTGRILLVNNKKAKTVILRQIVYIYTGIFQGKGQNFQGLNFENPPVHSSNPTVQ